MGLSIARATDIPSTGGGGPDSPQLYLCRGVSVFRLPTVARMVFESFAHVPVTEELLRHVWEGEPNGRQGGHRSGLGREGKTEFPEDWTLELVQLGIELTLAQPQWVKRAEHKITMLRQFAQVLIAVELKTKANELYFFTAYPMNGVGVYRNQRGIKVLLPLELPKWES